MNQPTPIFIVGTGRCGSTLLSKIVNSHPSLLSLSEFFTFITDLGTRIAESFPVRPITGAEFWLIIAGIHPKLATMTHHGVMMNEVLYRPGHGQRFTAETGIPAVLQTTLPHLGEASEDLFDDLERFVLKQPSALVCDHYQNLFCWLMQRLGKKIWVERSGGSLRLVARLRANFPQARFVHLVRDGRNCAISMRNHLGFRMAFIAMHLTEVLGVDPWVSQDRRHVEDLPDDLVPFLPERFDREAFLNYDVGLPLCGHYWSGEIRNGVAELSDLGPNALLTLHYEDFCTSPQQSIERLFEFIGVDIDAAWLDQMSMNMNVAKSDWSQLQPADLRELTDACHPGFEAFSPL